MSAMPMTESGVAASICDRFFKGTQYSEVAESVIQNFLKGDYKKSLSEFRKIPTKKQLLDLLVETLRGKSVYSTLKRVALGNVKEDYTLLKAISSLITHTLIECEHGKKYYSYLLFDLYEKFGRVLYNANSNSIEVLKGDENVK